MSQHTPGPWEVIRHEYRDEAGPGVVFTIAQTIEAGRYRVASLEGVLATTTPVLIARASAGETGEDAESEANARLIAAAPEMLALIRYYVEAYQDHPERLGSGSSAAHQTFTRARALLARIDDKGGN